MPAIELPQLWAAATVVAGFQMAAFSWRIKRELDIEMAGQSTCLTAADLLNSASFLLLVRGAFGTAILKGLPARC